MASSSRKSEKDFSKVSSKTLSIGSPGEKKDAVVVEYSKSFTEIPGLVVSPVLRTNSNSYLSGVSKDGFTIKFSSSVSGKSKLKYRASGRVKKDEEIEETTEETRSVEFGSSTVTFYRDDNTFDPVPTVVGYKYNYGRGQNHKWEIVSIPEGATTSFSDDSVLSPTFSTDSLGTHTLKLTITGDGYTRSDTTTFTVANRAPTVDLGDDVTYPSIKLGDVVFISHTKSDPDGDSLTSSAVIESKPKTSDTTLVVGGNGHEITPDILGTYIIKGIVDDGMGESNSVVVDFVNIIINTPPIATLTSVENMISYSGAREIILDGRLSSSPVGNPLSYSWSQVSRPEKADHDCILEDYYGNKRQKIKAPPTSGQYEIQLTVDDSIETISAILSFNVNYPPTASISGDAKIYTNLNYIFNGSGSSAEDAGQTLTYSWVLERFATTWSSLSSGFTGASTAALTINAPGPGTFRAILTVDDGYDTNSSIHLFDIFKPPEIDSFDDRPDAPGLKEGGTISILPTILSEGIIADTATLGYFWQLEAYTGAKWEVFNHSIHPSLNVNSTGINDNYTYVIIAPPGVYNSYCSKLRVKLTITDSNGTTDEYYSTEWNI